MDSGATNHVTNALGNININSEYQGNEKLTVGNGEKLLISHVGNSMLSTSNPHKHIALNDILYVPSITKNLLAFPDYCMIMILILNLKNLCALSRTRDKGKFW